MRQRGQFAAALTRKSDHLHLFPAGRFGGLNDVGRITAGRQRQQHASGAAMRLYLPGKDAGVVVVIGPGGEDRRIGGQRDDVQPAPFLQEAADQFTGDMLGVRGGTAIAADQNRQASGKRGGGPVHRVGHRLFKPGVRRSLHSRGAGSKVVT